MISKEMIRPQKKWVEKNFVWRTNWISPYESLWGIFEKFKYANNATVKDIYGLFGTNYVRNLKSHTIGRSRRNCIRPSGLDDDLIENTFMQSVIKKNTQYVDRISGVLPWRPSRRYSFIRNELYICPECIKVGLHSLFHQFKLLHECPYHLPLNIDIEEFPDMIQHLLSVLKPAYRSKTKLKHHVVKSAKYINNLISDTEKSERTKSQPLRSIKLYEALYGSSLQTLKGIAAHLRKNNFPKHKKCIQRIAKSNLTDELVCPQVYAYVHYDNLWFITKITPYRKHPGKLEFASKQDDSYLTNLFWDLEMDQDITLESYAKVKWIFNRIMSHLIWNHYKNWLSISQEAAEQRLQYMNIPFSMKDIPFYILIIPKNNNEPIEFHWWDKIKNIHKKLACPLNKTLELEIL
jgi:hypothetical protein